MSAPPPDTDLAKARRALIERGYLAPPPAGAGARRTVAGLLGCAVAWTVVLALSAAALGGAAGLAIPALAAALLPPCLGIVALASLVGRWLARILVRHGADPALATRLLAGAAGLLGAASVSLLPLSRPDLAQNLLLAAAGGSLALLFAAAAATGLARALAYRPVHGSARPTLLIGLAGLTIGVVAGVVAARPERAVPATAAGFPAPHGRVAVIGVDGLSRKDLEALAQDLPEIARASAWGWAPIGERPRTLPAVFWTTVACGVQPGDHGVEALDEVRLFGAEGVSLPHWPRRVLLAVWQPLGVARETSRPGLARRAPTVWEMASRAGCPVTVGGWWGSWPVRRLLGEVASERSWLAAAIGPDAVSTALAPLVTAAWSGDASAAQASDALAQAMLRRAGAAAGPHLAIVYLPALDLVRRTGELTPIALAHRLRPHAATLGRALALAEAGGFEVWLVSMPWAAGGGFVASSAVPAGRYPPVAAGDLAPTWLAQLGLPAPLATGATRADLFGGPRATHARAGYGPPPPPIGAPPRGAAALQREVLRSLGYLQ